MERKETAWRYMTYSLCSAIKCASICRVVWHCWLLGKASVKTASSSVPLSKTTPGAVHMSKKTTEWVLYGL